MRYVWIIHALVATLPLVLGSIVGRFSAPPDGSNSERGSKSRSKSKSKSRSKSDSYSDKSSWYDQEVKKPAYAPPPIVFSIVWPILYVLLGLSVFAIVFDANPYIVAFTYTMLALNLLFNLSYPVIMFTFQNLKYAMLSTWLTLFSAILLLYVVSMYAVFMKSRLFSLLSPVPLSSSHRWAKRVAPWLLVPYVVWLIFASVLATDVYLRNA